MKMTHTMAIELALKTGATVDKEDGWQPRITFTPDDLCRFAELVNNPDETLFSVSVYYIHDNHTFSRVYGTTVDEVLAMADQIEAKSAYGMLCPLNILYMGEGWRRVGCCVHSGAPAKWEEGKAKWKELVLADEQAIGLLKNNTPPAKAVDHEYGGVRK